MPSRDTDRASETSDASLAPASAIARDLGELAIHPLSAFSIVCEPGWNKTGSLNREAAWWVVYSGRVSVRLQGLREPIHVNRGDLLFLPVPVSGQITVESAGRVAAATVHFYPTIMGSWRRFGRLGFPNLYSAHPDAPWIPASRYLADLCAQPRPPSWRVEAAHIIASIMFYLARRYGDEFKPATTTAGHPAWERISPALRLVEARFADPELSVTDLAEAAGLGLSRFREVFHAALQHPPREHIRLRRIEEARRYLLTTGLGCKEIAARCGFSDTAYFYRTFKSMTGMTPKAFRKTSGESLDVWS